MNESNLNNEIDSQYFDATTDAAPQAEDVDGENSGIEFSSSEEQSEAAKPKKKRRRKKRRSGKNVGGSKPKKKLSEKEKTIRALKRLLTKIAVVGAIIAIILLFVISPYIYHDNAMFPAIKDGDLTIILKPGSAYNGDIVLYEANGGKRLARVVGIPGDTIDFLSDGTYTINGTVPYESIYFATRPASGSQVEFPYTVREGELLLFNDMRDDQNDSRVYGGINDSEIIGKVVLIVRRRGF